MVAPNQLWIPACCLVENGCKERTYKFFCGISLHGREPTEEEVKEQEEQERQNTLKSLEQSKDAK